MDDYPICAKCEFYGGQDPECQCKECMPTNFVTGKRYMEIANAYGQCADFKVREEPETGVIERDAEIV